MYSERDSDAQRFININISSHIEISFQRLRIGKAGRVNPDWIFRNDLQQSKTKHPQLYLLRDRVHPGKPKAPFEKSLLLGIISIITIVNIVIIMIY
jgi:hypothetical protein